MFRVPPAKTSIFPSPDVAWKYELFIYPALRLKVPPFRIFIP